MRRRVAQSKCAVARCGVKAEFRHPEPAAYWRQRLEVGMAHNLGLIARGLGNRASRFHYCNAVGLKRIGSAPDRAAKSMETVRAVFHGAMAIYLVRVPERAPCAVAG